jgi:uncharacterized protein with HEPN domain
MRVGEFSKQLIDAEPQLSDDPLWSQAARTRDFLAHHYHLIDSEQLWATIEGSLDALDRALQTLSL